MNNITKIASLIAMGLIVAPCLLYFLDMIGLETVKWTAAVGSIGWFIATPLWMSRELPVDAAEVEI